MHLKPTKLLLGLVIIAATQSAWAQRSTARCGASEEECGEKRQGGQSSAQRAAQERQQRIYESGVELSRRNNETIRNMNENMDRIRNDVQRRYEEEERRESRRRNSDDD
jgi:hypothetical protein